MAEYNRWGETEKRANFGMLLRTRSKSAIIIAGNNRGKEWKTEVGGFSLGAEKEAVRRLAVEESELPLNKKLIVFTSTNIPR
jgi:hypothetical protein